MSACYTDGRSQRADKLLTELAPQLRLGQTLSEARLAFPALRIRRRGDATEFFAPVEVEQPSAIAVEVTPEPARGAPASPESRVEGVEFVMSPEAAERVRSHIDAVFRMESVTACTVHSIAETDSVITWDTNGRGGVALTFPKRRVSSRALSHLFIYSRAWEPGRSLGGYGKTAC